MPTEHEPWFERRPVPTTAIDYPRMLHQSLARLECDLAAGGLQPACADRPLDRGNVDCGHWRIELLPRANSLAGLEVATGIHINPIAPKRAAKQLRSS